MFTELKDRTLWFDGDVTVKPEDLIQFALLGQNLEGFHVTKITDEVKQYNKFVPVSERVTIKENVEHFDFSWNIPEQYKHLDITEYVLDKFVTECDGLDDEEFDLRKIRVIKELKLYKELGLTEVLKTIIYAIETFKSKGVVWGVGRGSSVSSYVLFLIGVHDIDSVLYELDVEDFLRKE